MHAKDFVVNKGGDGHAIENILKFFPDADRVAAFALVVKAINPIDLTALVVAAQQEEVLLELHFVRQQQNNCLQTVLAAINIVAQEKIVRLGREAAIFKKPKQVRELSMSITYSNERSHKLSFGVIDENCMAMFLTRKNS